jgi:hypothetical protein
MSSTPSFLSIEMDISDSGREGCAVSTLTITSDPDKWKKAIAVAVQEVRRLQRHGVTRGDVDDGNITCTAPDFVISCDPLILKILISNFDKQCCSPLCIFSHRPQPCVGIKSLDLTLQ